MTFKTESVRIGENIDGTLSVTAMYSPVDSGFKSVERARELIDIELKKYGLPDDAISLYERVGEHWAKVNDKDLIAKKTLRDQFTESKKRFPVTIARVRELPVVSTPSISRSSGRNR